MALVNHASTFPLTWANLCQLRWQLSASKDPTLLLHREHTSVSHLQFLTPPGTICLSCFHFVLLWTQKSPCLSISFSVNEVYSDSVQAAPISPFSGTAAFLYQWMRFFLAKQLHMCAAKMGDKLVSKLRHSASLQGNVHYSISRYFFYCNIYEGSRFPPIRNHHLRLIKFLERHVMWTILKFTFCSVDRLSHSTFDPAKNSTGVSLTICGEGPMLFISNISWTDTFIKYKIRYLDAVAMSNCR